MTIEEIRQRIVEIDKIEYDNERAHSEEDELRHAVLEAIAAGADDPIGLAHEVLKTSEIKFTRWYA